MEEGSLAELFLGLVQFLLESFVLCLFFLDTSVTQGVARLCVVCKTVFQHRFVCLIQTTEIVAYDVILSFDVVEFWTKFL